MRLVLLTSPLLDDHQNWQTRRQTIRELGDWFFLPFPSPQLPQSWWTGRQWSTLYWCWWQKTSDLASQSARQIGYICKPGIYTSRYYNLKDSKLMCANTTNHLTTSIRKESRLSLSLLFWWVLRLSPSLLLWQLSPSLLLWRLSPSLLLWRLSPSLLLRWECTSCCVLSLSRDPSVQSLMMALAVSWWSV